MKGMAEKQHQSYVERTEDGDKEKKKKRRSRRSKHTPSVSGVSDSSVNAICMQSLKCSVMSSTSSMNVSSAQQYGLDLHASHDQGLAVASNATFSSLPPMHINGEAVMADSGFVQDQQLFPSDPGITVLSKSCPEPICRGEANVSFSNKEALSFRKNEDYANMQGKYFVPHLSAEAVNGAIEKGDAFRALFHVNAYNRLEAYCTIEGVPTDILISGDAAQNRAVEGDIVAVRLEPLKSWTRLKGSAGHINNSVLIDDCNVLPEAIAVLDDCKGKDKLDAVCEDVVSGNDVLLPDVGFHCQEIASASEDVHPELRIGPKNCNYGSNGYHASASLHSNVGSPGQNEASDAIGKLCTMISLSPSKRPTGSVVAIIERSPRRNAIVGFLGAKHCGLYKKEAKKNKNSISFSSRQYIHLTPIDAKFPKMIVSVGSLPDYIKERLKEGDATMEMELVAARIDDWKEDSSLPQAHVMHTLGRGGKIESQVAAILFQNAICSAEFSSESLSCLPNFPWRVPVEELEQRKDLRHLCTFTIDPSTATDLDDALSVERVSNDIFRVGVHVADISYFVLPETALDKEAQIRSTSVYLLRHKLPMLPSLLSEKLASLTPGAERFAFSIIWDINLAGDILDRWIGRTVIRSCCKLSYEQAQDIIEGLMDVESPCISTNGYPELHGQFEWHSVIRSVGILHEISKTLKENRFKDGALQLESPKLVFMFDEYGIPYDSLLYERKDSNFLVEEFMLLANRTAAEVISRAFPDCALLRRHPEPKSRKLREFEAFCKKHGLELDTSSSGQLHLSMVKIRQNLKNDPVLFDILISYASRSMQLAAYFCSGDLEDRETEWAHYSLAVPIYTHFTSPLRRYPDILVHRTLGAAIEAEDMYMKQQRTPPKSNKGEAVTQKCLTGISFDKDAAESKEVREALSAAALKHRVPCTKILADIAAYCNERNQANRHAEDAGDKLYLWAMLKKKETLISEAKVVGLGPKFMSIYIHKLAIERRIYYDEVIGLTMEWLETTSALVLDFCTNKRSQKRGSPGKCRTLEDVALLISLCDLKPKQIFSENSIHEEGTTQVFGAISVASKDPGPCYKPGISSTSEIDPAVFPLTVRLLSTIPVALHAVGGDDGPLDIGARLYLSSYFR